VFCISPGVQQRHPTQRDVSSLLHLDILACTDVYCVMESVLVNVWAKYNRSSPRVKFGPLGNRIRGPLADLYSSPPKTGSRTKRPATGRCGLRLPSPLTGAATNRPRRFRTRRPQFSTAGCPIPHPSPLGTGARMRGGVFPLSPLPSLGEGRGQGEWGEGPNRPGGFALRRPQFPTAGRLRATLLPGRGHRPWVGTAQNARQLEVAGFVCQAP